jgi:cellulose biosynthesis protein BcsQ
MPKKNKRVLAIDLDFQGSLTRVVLSDADYNKNITEQSYGNHSKAALLISGQEGE